MVDQLLNLYETLHELKPGPIVSFNRAIAIGYAKSPEAGIHALQKITSLQEHYLYLTAIGNFYLLNGDAVKAKSFLEKALANTTSDPEATSIKNKINKCV